MYMYILLAKSNESFSLRWWDGLRDCSASVQSLGLEGWRDCSASVQSLGLEGWDGLRDGRKMCIRMYSDNVDVVSHSPPPVCTTHTTTLRWIPLKWLLNSLQYVIGEFL